MAARAASAPSAPPARARRSTLPSKCLSSAPTALLSRAAPRPASTRAGSPLATCSALRRVVSAAEGRRAGRLRLGGSVRAGLRDFDFGIEKRGNTMVDILWSWWEKACTASDYSRRRQQKLKARRLVNRDCCRNRTCERKKASFYKTSRVTAKNAWISRQQSDLATGGLYVRAPSNHSLKSSAG